MESKVFGLQPGSVVCCLGEFHCIDVNVHVTSFDIRL